MVEGPIEINVKVLEPTRHKPFPGAKVTIALWDRRTNATVNANVGTGTTDANGKVSFQDRPPSPNSMYNYKVTVSPGPGQDFKDVSSNVQARSATAAAAATGGLDRAFVTFSVCPAGTDALVCEVAHMQVMSPFLDTPKHPRIGANWGMYKWWLPNMEVLPEEWPELVTNYEHMIGIWNSVPWPRTGELKDLFARCAENIPLFKDYKLVTQSLYLNRYSQFWPKTDEELRRLIATIALQGIPGIYTCMQDRIAKKIKDNARKMKKWQLIGMVAGMLLTGNLVASVIFNLATQLSQFKTALDFSKFMMGYAEFVEECGKAEAEDFTCTYLAPFVLWCMETLFMGKFYDQIAIEQGLPGAREGLTQEEVVKPIVEHLENNGITVPPAAYTPGGVAPKTTALEVAGGVGVIGVLALIAAGVFKK
jgi:hypothetical protein